MSNMSEADIEVRAAIQRIRDIQAEYEKWTEENEDICGYDDETWFDTISEFDQQLGSAGIELANLMERLMGID